MCGIVGFAGSQTIEPSLLGAMSDSLTHRGPDDSGVWYSSDRSVGFAHRRLAIIDLSPGGHQPMTNTAGDLHIAFNGEIYNYREVRDELSAAGHSFRTASDTEVILEAYRRWGEEFVRHLVGQFAFALHDAADQRLYLVRDRAGEKPLFVWQTPQRLVFASELKAILALPDAPRQLDPIALESYLAWGYVPGPRCILRGVRKVLPGSILRVDLTTGATRSWRYWDLPPHAPEAADEVELIEELDSLLFAAVKRQLVADVPVGILLSGGIDSSLVTAMAARGSSRPVKTFTVSFPGHGLEDESPHALRVAQHFGTDHTVLEAEASSVSLLHDLARQYDEPIADSSMVPTYLVSRVIRQHATVALGGDGGDELFGGYTTYSAVARIARMQSMVPRFVRAPLAAIARALPVTTRGRNFALAVGARRFDALAHINVFFSREWRQRLLSQGAQSNGLPESDRLALADGAETLLQAAQRIDFRSYMVDDILVKVDRASMLTSLEVRAPFLDPAVAEFAFGRVPDRLKVAEGEKKILPRRLAAKLLPADFDLARKQGFSIPASWFSREWGALMRDVLSEADPSIFRREAIAGIFKGQERMGNQLQRLFALTIFELWRRTYRITL